ncbi:MAG TPA: class I SAM-dependent methyltransferase [Solirubrobacterales bacterium]|jgi:ubiquinone/menaquinone biosynthesis C-methylase UbiE|nr:class I SAM-dependent methyltransferase [Solirubrobacterales bacterium]
MPSPALTPLAAAVLLVEPKPERILEIGCGEGDGVLFLAREFPVARVRGVDASEDRVRAATARVGLDPEGRVAFKPAQPGSLPFPDGFFDLVVQSDGRPSPGEIVRVLRPGGQLVLASSGPGEVAGRLLRWRLGRRGIALAESVAAGDGSFSVGRLRAGERAPADE